MTQSVVLSAEAERSAPRGREPDAALYAAKKAGRNRFYVTT